MTAPTFTEAITAIAQFFADAGGAGLLALMSVVGVAGYFIARLAKRSR